MRTTLTEDHRPRFEALSQDGAALVLRHLRESGALPRSVDGVPIVDRVASGAELFDICRGAGLDHAGVILTIASETSTDGLAAIEALVGRPVRPWAATVQQARAALPKPAARGVAAPRVRASDSHYIVSVAPNPKKPGSATHERYARYKVGMTVAQCLAAGLTRADIDWDTDPVRGPFVVTSPTPPDSSLPRSGESGA